MKASPLKKFVLPSILLSSAVFSALTLPLAVFGSEEILIQLENEPFFYGKVKDIAAPYLGLATAASIGVAISTVAVTGWRQSSRRSAQVEEELSKVQEDLKEKETEIEQIKVSEVQLAASGLNYFLEDGVATSDPLTSVVTSTIKDSEAVPHSVQISHSLAAPAQATVFSPGTHSQSPLLANRTAEVLPKVSTAVAEVPSLSKTEKTATIVEAVNNASESEALKRVNELDNKFQYVMSQLELIQQALHLNTQIMAQAYVPNNFNSSVTELPNPRPSRKSQRRPKKLAS